MALTGSFYITATEFRDYLTGLDLTGITDPQLEDYIRQASRLADSYINGTFDVVTRTERHMWSETRRVYPDNTPVNAVRALTIHIGSGQRADIELAHLFVNNHARYVEVVSLATATPLVAELVSLGLIEVVAEIIYKTGYGAFAATAITLSANIDAAVTTFDVSTTTGLAVDDVIQIDSESMWITAIVDANTITVVRGAQTNGSPVAHNAGAVISRFARALSEDVKLAVAMITASIIGARRMNEEGVTGVRSFLIGSYSVTYGAGVGNAGGSGFPFIPNEAAAILESYRHITLR